MTSEEKRKLLNEQYTLRANLEAQIKATNFVGIRIAEGKATKTEYKAQINERQQWRDAIDAANEEIARLQAIETEDEEPEMMEPEGETGEE